MARKYKYVALAIICAILLEFSINHLTAISTSTQSFGCQILVYPPTSSNGFPLKDNQYWPEDVVSAIQLTINYLH